MCDLTSFWWVIVIMGKKEKEKGKREEKEKSPITKKRIVKIIVCRAINLNKNNQNPP